MKHNCYPSARSAHNIPLKSFASLTRTARPLSGALELSRKHMAKMPTFDALMNPLLRALDALGGSGSVDEILEKVVELEGIPESVSVKPHNPEMSNQSELGYRLAWARTYLKKCGLLENSSRGVWATTPKARALTGVDPAEVVKAVRALDKEHGPRSPTAVLKKGSHGSGEDAPEGQEQWKAKLHEILTNEVSADAFERLTQRLLRESGFVSVEITGRTGDGGVDGKGIARINGLMSFHVIFQCKKYKGSVSAAAIRDFRGAMVGRADKGLFITTGTFTPAAVREATRDGAPPIDLVDGDELASKLKELGLGVHCKMVEQVTVDPEWFKNL